jgi:hypothetical protein
MASSSQCTKPSDFKWEVIDSQTSGIPSNSLAESRWPSMCKATEADPSSLHKVSVHAIYFLMRQGMEFDQVPVAADDSYGW